MSLEGFPGLPRTLIFQDATTGGGEKIYKQKYIETYASGSWETRSQKLKTLNKKLIKKIMLLRKPKKTRETRDPFRWFLGKAVDVETSTIFSLTLATPEFFEGVIQLISFHNYFCWWGRNGIIASPVGQSLAVHIQLQSNCPILMTWWWEFCDIIHFTWTWPTTWTWPPKKWSHLTTIGGGLLPTHSAKNMH